MSILLAPAFPEVDRVARALRAAGMRVAVAESCTGGLLGAVLTALPGSSDYVLGGVIAYSNRIKTALLGVDPALIERQGAVSPEVVRAMANGVRERTGADIGAAITGVAGPCASERKPAGLVFVGVATAQNTAIERLDGDLGREQVREHAVRTALRLLAEVAELR